MFFKVRIPGSIKMIPDKMQGDPGRTKESGFESGCESEFKLL